MRLFPIVLGTFVGLSFATASRADLLTNGDFSAGNTGFTSGYTYVPNNTTNLDEGIYSVGTTPSNVNYFWTNPSSVTDTVSNSPLPAGNMLFVNGASTPTTVWSQTVSGLNANTDYTFSGYLASLHASNPAILTITAGSQTILADLSAPVTAGVWAGFQTIFNTMGSTSVTFTIEDMNTAPSGNDFALDSLALNQTVVPEPSSVALLALGLAGIVAVRQRRRGHHASSCRTNQTPPVS